MPRATRQCMRCNLLLQVTIKLENFQQGPLQTSHTIEVWNGEILLDVRGSSVVLSLLLVLVLTVWKLWPHFFLLLWVAATLCIVTFLSARQPGTHKKKHVAPSAWVSQHKTTSAFSAPNPEFILLLTSNQGIPYLEARSASRKILRYSLKPFLCLWLDNLHPQFEHDVKQLIERYLFFVLFHWVYISINVVNICLYIWYETRNRRRHG